MAIELHNRLMRSRNIKIIYVLIVLLMTYFGSWLPDFDRVAGVESAIISSTAVFGPLNGMLLGPYLGGLVTFVGISAHFITSPERLGYHTFFLISPLYVVLSSVVAGFIIRGKERIALLIYASLIFSWYLLDAGREVFYYPWFHIAILILFLLVRTRLWDNARGIGFHTFTILLMTSLIAVLSDHMAGSIMAQILLDVPVHAYSAVIFIYPAERLILAFAAALVMYLLISIMYSSFMHIHQVEDITDNSKRRILCDYIRRDVKKILEDESEEKKK